MRRDQQFRLPPTLLDERGIKVVLEHLAMIVSREPWFCSKERGAVGECTVDLAVDTSWILGRQNDYWLHRRDESTFEITSRYGTPTDDVELRNVFVRVFGLGPRSIIKVA